MSTTTPAAILSALDAHRAKIDATREALDTLRTEHEKASTAARLADEGGRVAVLGQHEALRDTAARLITIREAFLAELLDDLPRIERAGQTAERRAELLKLIARRTPPSTSSPTTSKP